MTLLFYSFIVDFNQTNITFLKNGLVDFKKSLIPKKYSTTSFLHIIKELIKAVASLSNK